MKTLRLSIYLLVFITVVSSATILAVEIPLGGMAVKGLGSEEIANIGYVDIDLIFREHPMKKRLQEEFKSEYSKKMKESKELEDTISKLKKVIISSSTYAQNLKSEKDILESGAQAKIVLTGTSTVTVPTVTPEMINEAHIKIEAAESDILKMKESISKKESEYGKFIEDSRKELLKLEQKHASNVLADIYHLLEKAAIDENITIIVDKNNILYGKTAKDLTSQVIERLQGR